MNVLVINGSPKGERSNSYQLAEAFVRGIGDASLKIHHLAKLSVQPCKGCFSCWKDTPGACVIRDDVSDILNDMLKADIIIWCFPLFYYSVPGILKNLIDRQLPLTLPFMTEREDDIGNGAHPPRYDREWQRHVLISTCGFYTIQDNYSAVSRMFDHMCKKDSYTTLFCGQGELFAVPELKTTTDSYLRLVEKAGKEFIQGAISEKTKEMLAKPLFPKEVFEAMADASWGVSKSEDDTSQSPSGGQILLRQMAALYRKDSYPGTDRVLEFYFSDLNETYQIILGKDECRFLSTDFIPYTTRIETTYSVWNDIATGKISGNEALAAHQYRVLGSFSIMLDWDDIFYGGAEPEAAVSSKPTKMSILLMPWMIIWIFLSIDSFRGGFAGIFVCSALPMLWLKYEATVYEYLTVLLVSIFSAAAILQVDLVYLLPLSYGTFGLMWFSSVFCPVPLTAHYSKNGNGGNKALSNVIFMNTNRILTACWGILYLITPVWTWLIMKSNVSSYVGLINSVMPFLMGIFTNWFQHWYPRQIARSAVR